MVKVHTTTKQLDFISFNSTYILEKGFFLMILSLFIMAFSILFMSQAFASSTESKRIVALGDSLTSGYGLESGDSFPAQLYQHCCELRSAAS